MSPALSCSVKRRADPEQDQAHEYVPERLVEEGRVERGRVGELRRPVLRRDVYCPRQIRGPSEKLLVEVVAPAAYGLAEDEAGGGGVGEGEWAYGTIPAKEEHANKAASDPAVDTQAPLPDLQDRGNGLAYCVLNSSWVATW